MWRQSNEVVRTCMLLYTSDLEFSCWWAQSTGYHLHNIFNFFNCLCCALKWVPPAVLPFLRLLPCWTLVTWDVSQHLLLPALKPAVIFSRVTKTMDKWNISISACLSWFRLSEMASTSHNYLSRICWNQLCCMITYTDFFCFPFYCISQYSMIFSNALTSYFTKEVWYSNVSSRLLSWIVGQTDFSDDTWAVQDRLPLGSSLVGWALLHLGIRRQRWGITLEWKPPLSFGFSH